MSDNGSPEPDAAGDPLDHLQAAALELIDAARGVLDVLEQVVGDRQALDDVVGLVTDVAAASGFHRTGSTPTEASDRPHRAGGPDGPSRAESMWAAVTSRDDAWDASPDASSPPDRRGPPIETIVID